MQSAMDRLAQFTRRHRVPVALTWLALLIAALPFAARQTENLTSGGFEVPGSGSQAVDRGLAAFEGAQREQLAVVIARRPGAGNAEVNGAIDKVRGAADKVDNITLADRAAAAAKRKAGSAPITVVPLAVA